MQNLRLFLAYLHHNIWFFLDVPICGKNEKFTNCATLCPRTCDDSTPKICPLVCLTGCVCKENYIRESKDGKCIPEVACKKGW